MADSPRSIIQPRLAKGLTPRPDSVEFAKAVLDMDIRAYVSAQQHKGPVFFERGLLDPLYSLSQIGEVTMDQVERYKDQYPYNSMVFFFKPWADIYVKDSERDHPYSHAVAVAEIVIAWYQQLGFTMVEVPTVSPEDRATFVLDKIEVAQ